MAVEGKKKEEKKKREDATCCAVKSAEKKSEDAPKEHPSIFLNRAKEKKRRGEKGGEGGLARFLDLREGRERGARGRAILLSNLSRERKEE